MAIGVGFTAEVSTECKYSGQWVRNMHYRWTYFGGDGEWQGRGFKWVCSACEQSLSRFEARSLAAFLSFRSV